MNESGEADSQSEDPTLAPLVSYYKPTEFRVTGMISGLHFSDALHALEVNQALCCENLRVLHLGLVAGGPRPYQDTAAHQRCIRRLIRVLGGVVDDDETEWAPGTEGATAEKRTCWPRLRELRLSCGIVGGDLEGVVRCLGR